MQTDDDLNELHEALAALAHRVDPSQTEAKRTTISVGPLRLPLHVHRTTYTATDVAPLPQSTMRDLCQVAHLHLEEKWDNRRASKDPNGHGHGKTGTYPPLSGPLSWFALPTTGS